MPNNTCIAVDNYEELMMIQDANPGLKESPLILLSDSFNLEQLESFKNRECCYFDDVIDDETAKVMTKTIYKILWGWFIDENGHDISRIKGLSLGITFCGSLEILLNSIIKYEVGLTRLLKPGQQIYFVSTTDDVFLEVIKDLQGKIGFESNIIRSQNEQRVVLHGKHKLKLDPGSRKRDLSPYFKSDLKMTFLSVLLKVLRKCKPVNKKPEKMLLLSAGKLGDFISVKAKGLRSAWILPFASIRELYKIIVNKLDIDSKYLFFTSNDRITAETNEVVLRLKKNVLRQVHGISSKTLINLMERYAFSYAPGMVSYFGNVVKELAYLKPVLVIISTDVIEPHLIVVQAAKKLGIKTALLPHGMDDWGHKELRVGEMQVIDYCFAYGKKHVMDNIGHGVSPSNIVITSFPYFAKFLPIKANKPRIYRRAIVLTPDYVNMSPAAKQGYFFRYFNEVIAMLKLMGIELLGVKSRGDFDQALHSIYDGLMIMNGEKIRWFTGDTNFDEIAQNADILIGSHATTALIEAGLIGIDYYAICQKSEFDIPSASHNVEKIIHVAHTIDELRDNILKRKIYRDGYSVEDFIDLKGIASKEDLYEKFESSIEKVVKLS